MATYSIGRGTKVSIGKRATPAATTFTFSEIKDVFEMSLPEITVDEVEVTSFSSPNKSRQFISGLSDSGEVEFQIRYDSDNAQDDLLAGLFTSGEEIHVKYELVTGHVQVWAGFVKGYQFNISDAEAITRTLTIRINEFVE